MSNVGIIAGGGKLPIVIGKNLIKKNFNIFFFVIDEFFKTTHYKGLDVTIINLINLDKQYGKISEIEEMIQFIKKSNKRGIATFFNE